MITRCILAIVTLCAAGFLCADVVTYTYDDAGRLMGVAYPNGASISYTYDAAGNLTARTVTAASTSAKKPDPKAKPGVTNDADKATTGKAAREKTAESKRPAN